MTHYKNNDTREDTVGPQNGLANNWRVTRAKKSARNDTSIEGTLALEREKRLQFFDFTLNVWQLSTSNHMNVGATTLKPAQPTLFPSTSICTPPKSTFLAPALLAF